MTGGGLLLWKFRLTGSGGSMTDLFGTDVFIAHLQCNGHG